MSEETKHTPGPWEWDGIDPEWLVQSGTAESVLFVVDTRDGGRIKVRDRDKPLIAAAPDLLEALECLLADTCQEGYYSQADNDSVINAKAAIAKARGGQDGE